jgi:predicted PurR-regulated permease PerM
MVFGLFLALVVAFWTLKDLPKIRQELRTLAGEKYELDLENLLGTVVHVVGGYLKGQTIVSLVTGTLAGIGLAIVGVPYALVLAIITFVFNYVPYVGPILSGLIAGIVGLFVSPLTAVLAIVVVIAAQQVTDLFLTPRVMSDQVDLHPTLVVFSLLVGGALFGFWGMIFSIPVAATFKGLFVYYYERRTNRLLATENGALFRTAQCDDTDEPCEDPATASNESAETADTMNGSK